MQASIAFSKTGNHGPFAMYAPLDSEAGVMHARERTLSRPAQQLDARLRQLASEQRGLDARESSCLREVERYRIWREHGFPTVLAYLEDRLGYAPRTAVERLRVARALGDLPAMEQALARGALSHSVVRELSRVATSATEQVWMERAAPR